MTRQVVCWLTAFTAVTLLINTAVGQNTPDRVTVRQKDGTTKVVDGSVQFGPTGFQIAGPDKKNTPVAYGDIAKIFPGDMPGVERTAITTLVATEEKRTKADYEKARLGYTELLTKAAAAPVPTKRFIEFKVALMTNRVADETGYDEKWGEAALAASKKWAEFATEYKGSWELWPAGRNAARLNAELGKFDEAARMWSRLAKADAGLPPDLKMEAAIQEIDANIRTRVGAGAAQAAADALAKTAAGPTKDKLDIYEMTAKAIANNDPLTAVKGVQDKIAATKDTTVRGVAYSMLGELYLAANKPREAMWEFLATETLYNTDRDEAFKAMCRLVEAFKAQGNDDMVRSYQEKLRRTRGNF